MTDGTRHKKGRGSRNKTSMRHLSESIKLKNFFTAAPFEGRKVTLPLVSSSSSSSSSSGSVLFCSNPTQQQKAVIISVSWRAAANPSLAVPPSSSSSSSSSYFLRRPVVLLSSTVYCTTVPPRVCFHRTEQRGRKSVVPFFVFPQSVGDCYRGRRGLLSSPLHNKHMSTHPSYILVYRVLLIVSDGNRSLSSVLCQHHHRLRSMNTLILHRGRAHNLGYSF